MRKAYKSHRDVLFYHLPKRMYWTDFFLPNLMGNIFWMLSYSKFHISLLVGYYSERGRISPSTIVHSKAKLSLRMLFTVQPVMVTGCLQKINFCCRKRNSHNLRLLCFLQQKITFCKLWIVNLFCTIIMLVLGIKFNWGMVYNFHFFHKPPCMLPSFPWKHMKNVHGLNLRRRSASAEIVDCR